jgi:hypothetical protein
MRCCSGAKDIEHGLTGWPRLPEGHKKSGGVSALPTFFQMRADWDRPATNFAPGPIEPFALFPRLTPKEGTSWLIARA